MVKITFTKALKVWWSYIWRSMVVMFPALPIVPIFMFATGLMPIPKPGMPPVNLADIPGFFSKMAVIWVVMMVVAVCAQSLAMMWMLRTKWSDFKLIAVPPQDGTSNVSSEPQKLV